MAYHDYDEARERLRDRRQVWHAMVKAVEATAPSDLRQGPDPRAQALASEAVLLVESFLHKYPDESSHDELVHGENILATGLGQRQLVSP